MSSPDVIEKLLKVYGNGLAELTPSSLTCIFENIFGSLPEGCVKVPESQSDDITNVELIIKSLQDDILQIDLSHINAKDVVYGDLESIQNLAEILVGYVEYILGENTMESVDDKEHEEVQDEKEDKNMNLEFKSPVRRVILDHSTTLTTPSPIKDATKDSAFLLGYAEGLEDDKHESNDNSSYSDLSIPPPQRTGSSLLERLRDLPHLSETLRSRGLDIRDYTPEPLPPPNYGRDSEPDLSELNTEQLLNVYGFGEDATSSTPYPTAKSKRSVSDTISNPVSDKVSQEVRYNEEELGEIPQLDMIAPFPERAQDKSQQTTPYHPRTKHNVRRERSPDSDRTSEVSIEEREAKRPTTPELDRSIKERLLYLLEKSGNTAKRTARRVRYEDHPSPGKPSPRNRSYDSVKREFEVQKSLLEGELKQKIQRLKLKDKASNSPKNAELGKISKSANKKSVKAKSGSGVVRSAKADDLNESSLLPYMIEEFPYLDISPQTARMLWNKQVKHIQGLKLGGEVDKAKLVKKHLREEEQRQTLLLNLMKKELEFTSRQNRRKNLLEEKRLLKAKVLERKLTAARIRKYHQEYCERTRAKMTRKNISEEIMFKEIFEKGIKIQKQRALEAKQIEKEESEKERKAHERNLRELENYYRNQCELLTKELEEEQRTKEIQRRDKAAAFNKHKIYQRNLMKKHIEKLQREIVRDEDHLHYKLLDFEKLLQKL